MNGYINTAMGEVVIDINTAYPMEKACPGAKPQDPRVSPFMAIARAMAPGLSLFAAARLYAAAAAADESLNPSEDEDDGEDDRR
jgi:hypothetical protein